MFGSRGSIVCSRIAESRRSPRTTRRLARPATARSLKAMAAVQRPRQTASSLHWLTVVLALAASLIFVLTDADGGRSSLSLWIQMTIEVAAAVGFTWLVRRRVSAMNGAPMIMPLLLTVVLASLLWEPFQRWFLLSGRPFEMMVMHSQKNLMLATAVFGCWVGYQRLSILIGVASGNFLCGHCPRASHSMADRHLWICRRQLDDRQLLGHSAVAIDCRRNSSNSAPLADYRTVDSVADAASFGQRKPERYHGDAGISTGVWWRWCVGSVLAGWRQRR